MRLHPRTEAYRGSIYADILELIAPRASLIVGRVVKGADGFTLKVFDRSSPKPVPLEGYPLIDGQYVEATLLQRPSRRHPAKAKVVHVLGDDSTPGIESEVTLAAYHIARSWRDEQVKKRQVFRIAFQNKLQKRRDLRSFPFVTIDGADAKDFDDAVYAQKSDHGSVLWVAIADVSHYVQEGGALDQEAAQRGNSIYLPQRVVPMLPEVLANDLCSLKPEVDRLVMVCEMHLDHEGELQHYELYEGVIHSVARLTYQQVSDWFCQEKTTGVSYSASLLVLNQLLPCLLKKRQHRGALDFASQEIGLVLDDAQQISDMHQVTRLDSHRQLRSACF